MARRTTKLEEANNKVVGVASLHLLDSLEAKLNVAQTARKTVIKIFMSRDAKPVRTASRIIIGQGRFLGAGASSAPNLVASTFVSKDAGAAKLPALGLLARRRSGAKTAWKTETLQRRASASIQTVMNGHSGGLLRVEVKCVDAKRMLWPLTSVKRRTTNVRLAKKELLCWACQVKKPLHAPNAQPQT